MIRFCHEFHELTQIMIFKPLVPEWVFVKIRVIRGKILFRGGQLLSGIGEND